MRYELPDGTRRQADTKLVVLDLAGYTDKHLDLDPLPSLRPQGGRHSNARSSRSTAHLGAV
jgi:hypothetical protein